MKKAELTKEEITVIIRDYLISKGIKKASLFGSFIRDDFDPKKSDIDILVEPFPQMTLWDMIHIQDDLKKKVKKKIDLGNYDGLKRFIKERVLNESVRII